VYGSLHFGSDYVNKNVATGAVDFSSVVISGWNKFTSKYTKRETVFDTRIGSSCFICFNPCSVCQIPRTVPVPLNTLFLCYHNHDIVPRMGYLSSVFLSSSSSVLFELLILRRAATIPYKDAFQSSKQLIASPHSSQPALLHLRQGPASTEESHKPHNSSGGQGLEKVPTGVVHEEDTLHC
jgi:hypothetical protein